MKKRLACSIFALLALLALQLAAAPAAQAHAFGDPHNCEALAQGATYGPGNLTSSPFDAYQIPNSPAFSSGSNYLVACQEREVYPSDPQPGFNNANWDGYGNPFQCVELIDRYTHLRYGDSYSWGDAGSD